MPVCRVNNKYIVSVLRMPGAGCCWWPDVIVRLGRDICIPESRRGRETTDCLWWGKYEYDGHIIGCHSSRLLWELTHWDLGTWAEPCACNFPLNMLDIETFDWAIWPFLTPVTRNNQVTAGTLDTWLLLCMVNFRVSIGTRLWLWSDFCKHQEDSDNPKLIL